LAAVDPERGAVNVVLFPKLSNKETRTMRHSSPKTALRSSTNLTSATRRTILAHEFRTHLGLTIAEACARTGANKTYVVAYGRLDPGGRIAVLDGAVKLSHIVGRKPPGPAAVDSYIARAGAGLVLDRLDHATRPAPDGSVVDNGGDNNGGGEPPFEPPFTPTFFPEIQA
jgi:hypothetical protein